MGQKHKRFREFWTPFLLRVIRKNPRSIYASVSKVMARFVLKIEKIVPYHGANPNTRNGARLRSLSPIMAPGCTCSTNHMTIKISRDLVTHIFPRFLPVTYICLVFPLVHCSVYVVIALGFTTLNRKTKTSFGSMTTYCYNNNDRDCESPDESSVRRHPTTERNDKTRLQNTACFHTIFWNKILCSHKCEGLYESPWHPSKKLVKKNST